MSLSERQRSGFHTAPFRLHLALLGRVRRRRGEGFRSPRLEQLATMLCRRLQKVRLGAVAGISLLRIIAGGVCEAWSCRLSLVRGVPRTMMRPLSGSLPEAMAVRVASHLLMTAGAQLCEPSRTLCCGTAYRRVASGCTEAVVVGVWMGVRTRTRTQSLEWSISGVQRVLKVGTRPDTPQKHWRQQAT